MDYYRNIIGESQSRYERNDCVVISLAIALDISYDRARDHAVRYLGRRARCGVRVTNQGLSRILGIEGRTFKDVDLDAIWRAKGSGLTPKTLPQWLPRRGIFLCFTRGHMFCYRAGRIQDWTEERKHRITRIVRVTKV